MAANRNHPSFLQPDNLDIKIWRYMDFTKYVSLISNQAIYFNRIDKFEDPFEGVSPLKDREFFRSMFKRTDMIIEEATGWDGKPDNSYVGKKMSEAFFLNMEKSRQEVYVNCWHMNNFESAAMWRLYAKTEEAVAIQTTYDRLQDTLPNEIYLGVVKYIDYEKDSIVYIDGVTRINTFDQCMHKRKSFEHEKEVRAVLWSHTTNTGGFSIPLNLSNLIENVFIAPKCNPWFRELVENVTDKYGYKFPVQQSNLYEVP